MAIKALIYQAFEGGWSIGKKIGIQHSFAYSQQFDFRKTPSQMSVLPGLQREDNGIIDGLVQNEVMVNDGTIFAIDDSGKFYKRTTTGIWSIEANIGHGTFGIDYRKDTDSIYIPTRKSVSLYNNVSNINGSAAMYMNYYGPSYSTADNSANTAPLNVQAYTPGPLAQTYTTPTTINEGQTDLRYFQSDIEPLMQIAVYVINKGTGDWTLTLHDGTNQALATATIANANLVNNTFNNFVFTGAPNGQVRIYVTPNARTYHIHVTSTVADGTVSTAAVNDLSQCALEVWADRLIMTNNGMHPMDRFLQYELFGNGNYVSAWEPISTPPSNTDWQRHRLVFPMQYEVCGLAHTNEYEVIALEQDTTDYPNSTQQAGLIAFWDGSSPTYNYYLDIAEGSPYGLFTYKNVVYYYAGGDWYALTSPTTLPTKIRKMPGSDTEFSGTNAPILVYPYAATVRRGILLMAYPSMTTNTSINFGVYSWGAVDKNFPQSFGQNYILSTGTQNYTAQNGLTIGMVKNFGDTLHVSWHDSSAADGGYGIDVINNTSLPSAMANWQGLIFDNGYVGHRKMAVYVECYYSLPADSTIQLGYSIDRGTFINDTNVYSATNLWQGVQGYARFSVNKNNQGLFYEFQPQITIQSNTATTAPIVYMVGVVFDDRKENIRE